MLQVLRDRISGVFAWGIVILLVVPFALWGIGNYAGIIAPSYVAKVNGAKISQQDFTRAYQNQYQQLRNAMGPKFNPDETKLKQQVLQGLIDNQLLTQHTLDAGYRIGDQVLVAKIHALPAFAVGGKFSVDVYRTLLEQNGYSPRQFESQYRNELSVDQLRSGIATSAITTGPEFDRYVALVKEQRKIGYLKVAASAYLDQVKPTDAEISSYYASHKQQFMTPEKVTIAYIELAADKLAQQVKVDDSKLRELYQSQKDKFVKQAQRKAAHILIAVHGKDQKADDAAKAKAESVLKKIRAGADFAKLAKQYSDDPGSAKQGGELGWIQRGELDKNFEDALFGMNKAGDVTGPVKTQYGYHIIKLEGIRKPRQETFAEARDALAQQYRQKQGEDEYYKLGDKLSNLAFDHPDSLKPIHDALKLPIKQVSGVTRDSGTGVAANPDVRDAAFSDEVLGQGNNHLVKLGEHHAVVLRDMDRQPAKLKPLAAVKADIVKALKQQGAAKQAQAVADKINAAIQSGKTLDAAAAAEHLKAEPAKFVGRSSTDLPAPLATAAFKAPPPAGANKPSAGTVALGNGDQAVYAVLDIKPGDPKAVTGIEKQLMIRQLVSLHAQADLAAYVEYLHSHADIDIEKNNIQ